MLDNRKKIFLPSKPCQRLDDQPNYGILKNRPISMKQADFFHLSGVNQDRVVTVTQS